MYHVMCKYNCVLWLLLSYMFNDMLFDEDKLTMVVNTATSLLAAGGDGIFSWRIAYRSRY